MTLPIPQAWLERVAVGLDEVEDAFREFNMKVQIVSRPPDFLRPNVAYLNSLRWIAI